MNKPDLLGKFPFSHIWANGAPKWAKNGPKRGFILFFDKTCHLILLKTVEDERLLHGSSSPISNKILFLGLLPKML